MTLKIIGTSHIAQQSIQEIKTAIETLNPDIIAVELDINRAAALMQKQKSKISLSSAFQIGFKGYIFAKIGQIVQQKLGKMVGVAPGSDMKTALELARKHKKEIALIDQPIQITLKNFSKEFTWKERFRVAFDIIKGFIQPKKQMRELGFQKLDLTKVPKKELITKMIGHVKKRYPSLYKVLIEDRNKYMVKKLVKLLRDNPDKLILAIVGAGHEDGMRELLNKVDIVR